MIADYLTRLGDLIGQINNYIQFLLLAFAIAAGLIFFTIPYVRPLRRLLGPLGLGFTEITSVLWICYNSPRKLIRVYIELAIFHTGGQYQNRQWWRKFRRKFKRFLDDQGDSGPYVAKIDTCFDVASAEFNELVANYFEFFKQNKASDKFAIPADEPVSFIIQTEINEGFIVPITFITGLNDRYDEDWEKILGNYFTAFGEEQPPETAILPEELYFTYNWLMWGPSYQIKYAPQKNKLIQYGFGDESNSVNIVLKNDQVGNSLWEKICHEGDETQGKKFGYNCMIRGRLVDTSEYYNFKRDEMDLRAMPFLKRLSAESLGVSFLMELEHYEVKHSLKADNYFFSAYLWIMFALVDQTNPGFTPRKSVTFFEHANLADTTNYLFLANTLVEKCIGHFQYIASHKDYKVRKYQLCLSMNTFIESLFLKRLHEIRKENPNGWFSTNLSTETPFSISEILDTFDNYFVSQESEIEVVGVQAGNKEGIRNLCNFYADTYLSEFKNLPSALSLDRMFALMRRKPEECNFHVSLAMSAEGEVIGGATSLYMPESRCGVIDSIAVGQNFRNNGTGKRLINHSLQMLRQDALQKNGRGLQFLLARVPHESDQQTLRKFRFWANNGFLHLPENTRLNHHGWAIHMLTDETPASLPKTEVEKAISEYERLASETMI
jgi:GNAT superfamily N-acetyltransferase